MSQTANVSSIETIKEFRNTLCRFAEDTKNGLGAVEMEIRRITDWLLHERPMYWQMEIKRRKEDLSQAQAQLFRKKLQARPGSQVRDTEEKEAARIAQRRLLEAEEKLEIVKKWAPVFQHAVAEYQSRARPTGDMLESDVKLALELLDRMAGALDAYVTMAPPTMSNMDAAVSSSPASAGDGSLTPMATTSPAAEPAVRSNAVEDQATEAKPPVADPAQAGP